MKVSNHKKHIFLCLLVGLISFTSCTKEESQKSEPDSPEILNLPEVPFDYSTLNLPSHFTTNLPDRPIPTSINGADNTPDDNPVTDHGATLGRVLFYDKKLSANGTISCASCHKQEKGFSDDAVFSLGFDGEITPRHSMTLINARYYARGRFFWDERASTLEEQVLMPFQDPIEMGLTLEELVEKVKGQPHYPELFQDAFGNDSVNPDRIAKALAQFVRSIVSYSSKYDEGRSQVNSLTENFPNFSSEENLGKNIFFSTSPSRGAACFVCHTSEAFINISVGPQNNGLDAQTTDAGAGNVFDSPLFEGRFKTSTLRNIELTAPYMHDGRFDNLEQVIEHYNSGVQPHPNLSASLADENGQPERLNLNEAERAALVAFLRTLTDETIATEEKWSNPFQ